MKKTIIFILFNLILSATVFAQKIDVDSLLVQTAYQIKTEKNYAKAIELAKLGIKISPDYLDFHVALGRAYKMNNEIDSARYYFNYVIDKNPKYKEAFSYLALLEIEGKNQTKAINTIDKALVYYPEDKDFYILKLKAITLNNDNTKTIAFLNYLIKKYPKEVTFKEQLIELKLKFTSDRVGISYNKTFFNRDGVGPWHLLGFQYARERKTATLIGRVNYADRISYGEIKNKGIQYEFETYFKTSKKNYSYINTAFSDDIIFPKVRLSYSFFQNLGHSWESESGVRYNKTRNNENYSAVLGIGKYINSGWLNLKSYIQLNQKKPYPSFSLTYRYYYNSKYDYFSLGTGYGTSPDERESISSPSERISLNSYRVSAGYNKIFWKKFIFGTQIGFNKQEYTINKFQNEINISMNLQYKLK